MAKKFVENGLIYSNKRVILKKVLNENTNIILFLNKTT